MQACFFADDLQRHWVLVGGQQVQQLKHALQHLDAGRFRFGRFHGAILSQFAGFLYSENASCITRCVASAGIPLLDDFDRAAHSAFERRRVGALHIVCSSPQAWRDR